MKQQPSPVCGGLAPGSARYRAAWRFLHGRIDYERAHRIPYQSRLFKLERMEQLLERIGGPHTSLPAIHVAGTKGKGSTAAMTAAILSASGYRTALFTSPHLSQPEERLRVDGQPCSAEEFASLVEQVVPEVRAMDRRAAAAGGEEIGPTYFEILTAVAMKYFAQRRVDFAVLEVGLGGRLDATNVCRPLVSVITSISFDHTEQLGDTLASIAAEKAGIIKPAVPLVSGVSQPEARRVIHRCCERKGARLLELGRDFRCKYHPPGKIVAADPTAHVDFQFDAAGVKKQYRQVPLPLLGTHQAANAALSLAVTVELERLGFRVPEHAIRHGLARLSWPARIELLSVRPAVVLDSAHNRASVEALLDVLQESFRPRRRLLLFAAAVDKDVSGMLSVLLPQFDSVVFTRFQSNPRAMAPKQLSHVAEQLGNRGHTVIAGEPISAMESLWNCAGDDDLICIAGSFYLAAEVRPWIVARARRSAR